MIIDCIADLHGFFPKLEGGDLLIIAGDITARDDQIGWCRFDQWLFEQTYEDKILIGGNHDNFIQSMDEHRMWKYWEKNPNVTYLCDSWTQAGGLKIWGSPWTKTFPGMNPKCKAFTVDTEEELLEKWALIPDKIDILITHSPMYGRLDLNSKGEHCGSTSLAKESWRIQPRLHVFGHIHEAYGKYRPLLEPFGLEGYPISVNASHVNEYYEPINRPVRIEL